MLGIKPKKIAKITQNQCFSLFLFLCLKTQAINPMLITYDNTLKIN